MKYANIKKKVARKLEDYPKIRGLLKSVYHTITYIVHHKIGFQYELHPYATIRGLLNEQRSRIEAFFGYYDKTPWSFDNKFYLVHIYDPADRSKIKIGIFECDTGDLRVIDETPTFNFQQGAMLRWLNQDSYKIIYNTVENRNLVAKIKDAVSGDDVATVPMPIQSVNRYGTEALTLNYRRLYKLRPEYGYNVFVNNFYPDMDYDSDGIWRVNLLTGESQLIITIGQLISTNYHKTMKKSKHKINHIMYSPSGKRFVFMHRWIGPNGKYSRLYSANIDGSDIYCLMDDRLISHYYWLDDERLIVWGRKNTIGDKYYLLYDRTQKFEVIGDGVLEIYGDGHPSVSPNKRWIVTDTYPDEARIRRLILFDLVTNKRIILGKFYAPWKYDGGYRCDLHPRWSPDGTKISIDSAHEGFRNSYIIDVTRVIENV